MGDKLGVTRRAVIAGAFIPVTALTAAAKAVLTPPQRKTLEAFVDRLVPHDQYGPSASEAGVAEYIDRSLSDFLAPEKSSMVKGLLEVDSLAQRTYQAPFTQLDPTRQDQLLTSMENNTAEGFEPNSRTFFDRIRQLTMEGMFGDPYYGGNRAYAGWDLIRYPGPRFAVGPEEQKIGVEIKPVRGSARGASHEH
jgi:gluconate 2-dehydrogenase gamma chain